MVVGAKERVEWARKDVVARGEQETEGAGRVSEGEQGKANAGDREVVPPREESMADGGGLLTEGRVEPSRGGLGVGVVGGDQGASCMGRASWTWRPVWEKQTRGSCRGLSHPTVAGELTAARPVAASTWSSRA